MKHATTHLLFHGGDILSASREYAIPLEEWVDLSTGVNPAPYPVVDLPQSAFSQLPYIRTELLSAANRYYGEMNDELALLAIPGSQAAIQALPNCLPLRSVLLPQIGYSEHQHCWQARGTECNYYPSFDRNEAEKSIDHALKTSSHQHLVIINPNNPTGLLFKPEKILSWANALSEGCFVIVDEAFIDLTPANSVICPTMPSNVIVLRSFGKLFGLAGIRLGFLLAAKPIVQQVEKILGPWAINGPAQSVAMQALQDSDWQQQAIATVNLFSQQTLQLLSPLLQKLQPLQQFHGILFSSYLLNKETANTIHAAFAQRGILLRLIPVSDQLALLRFGIINGEDQSQIESLKRCVQVILY